MHVPGVIILIALIGFALLISERAGRHGGRRAMLSRKLLHITGVGSLAISPLVIPNANLLIYISGAFSLILFIAVKNKWFAADIYNRPSWGIALFPASFFILWLFWGKQNPSLVILPMLVLAFSDAAAAVAGSIFQKGTYNLTGDSKSIGGSFAFLVVTIFCLLVFPSVPVLAKLPGWEDPFALLSFPGNILLILSIAIVASIAEGLTSGGWDNVTVPLTLSWLLAVLPGKSAFFVWSLLFIMLLFAFLAFLAKRQGWLNTGGAVTAGLLGLVTWTGGGWKELALLAVFFITGSIAGKLKSNNDQSDAKKGKPRDFMQVICNGGIAGFCMIWAGLQSVSDGLPFVLFAVSVAVSTADTWSSEFGIFFSGKVVDIIGFRTLPSGVSGGISWQGTLAGIAGAGLIAFLATIAGYGFGWFIWVAGFAGMLFDSILGSLIQARYLVKGELSDNPGLNEGIFRNNQGGQEYPGEGKLWAEEQKSTPDKGLKWVTNDWVNLLSNLIITLIAGFLLLFLWKGG